MAVDTRKTMATPKAIKPIHIVFIHLDLGIGGAEQLIINLALASLPSIGHNGDTKDNNSSPVSENKNDSSQCLMNGRVSIFTTHCDQSHCFDAVRKNPTHINPNPGRLADCVHIVGSFLPVNVFRYGTALCSTVRMLYLSLAARWMYPDADLFVLDVLPTPIPYLIFGTGGGVKSVIFYCHFPDKLLTRDTVNGVPTGVKINSADGNNGFIQYRKQQLKSFLQSAYRRFLDRMEEWSMSFSDLILLNSNFTKQEVLMAFPTLANKHETSNIGDSKLIGTDNGHMQVLYPAIDLKGFIPPNFAQKRRLIENNGNGSSSKKCPIVSLNRFERKKNIGILLRAYAKLHQIVQTSGTTMPSTDLSLPPLIISGGYDPNNRENEEYLTELKNLAESLNIAKFTSFRPSISDDERASLLQSALCVVYTPFREHFGIVPLEAMYAGSAVVALKSGGPMETVIDGETGILVNLENGTGSSSSDTILAKVLHRLVHNPKEAIEMGQKGHEHVKKNFGLQHFREKWTDIVLNEGIPRGERRRKEKEHNYIWIQLLVVAMLGLILSLFPPGER